MSLLRHDEVADVLDAVLSVRLDASSRAALVVGIPPHVTHTLPQTRSWVEQLLLDINHLSDIGSLRDGSIPLLIYLGNAAILAKGRREEKLLHDLRDRVAKRLSDDVSKASEASTPQRVRYLITIDAPHTATLPSVVASLQEQLRTLSGDGELLITRVERGSLRLFIESLEQSYHCLQVLFTARRLPSLGPYALLSIAPLQPSAHATSERHAPAPAEGSRIGNTIISSVASPSAAPSHHSKHPHEHHVDKIRRIVATVAPTETKYFELMWADYIDEPHRPLNEVGPMLQEAAFGASTRQARLLSTFLIPLVAAIVAGEIPATESAIWEALRRMTGREQNQVSQVTFEHVVRELAHLAHT